MWFRAQYDFMRAMKIINMSIDDGCKKSGVWTLKVVCKNRPCWRKRWPVLFIFKSYSVLNHSGSRELRRTYLLKTSDVWPDYSFNNNRCVLQVELGGLQNEDSRDQITVQELEEEPGLLSVFKTEAIPKGITLVCAGGDVDGPSLRSGGKTGPNATENQDNVYKNDSKSQHTPWKLADIPNTSLFCKMEPNHSYKDEEQLAPLDLCAVKLVDNRKMKLFDEKVDSGKYASVVLEFFYS